MIVYVYLTEDDVKRFDELTTKNSVIMKTAKKISEEPVEGYIKLDFPQSTIKRIRETPDDKYPIKITVTRKALIYNGGLIPKEFKPHPNYKDYVYLKLNESQIDQLKKDLIARKSFVIETNWNIISDESDPNAVKIKVSSKQKSLLDEAIKSDRIHLLNISAISNSNVKHNDEFLVPHKLNHLKKISLKELPPLSNHTIDVMMGDIKEYLGTFPNNALPFDKIDREKKQALIVNLEDIGEDGSHWVAIFADTKTISYFDSFGAPMSDNVKRFCYEYGLPVVTNTEQLQGFNKNSCGFHAMHFIRSRIEGESFYNYVNGERDINKREDDLAEQFKEKIVI